MGAARQYWLRYTYCSLVHFQSSARVDQYRKWSILRCLPRIVSKTRGVDTAIVDAGELRPYLQHANGLTVFMVNES
jgi:hypothetical protein